MEQWAQRWGVQAEHADEEANQKKEGETMEREYEALFRAILELIDKCDTIEELRESVKRIMAED